MTCAREFIGYWVCPRCGIMWPLNPHGFAVTCDCDDGTANDQADAGSNKNQREWAQSQGRLLEE